MSLMQQVVITSTLVVMTDSRGQFEIFDQEDWQADLDIDENPGLLTTTWVKNHPLPASARTLQFKGR